MKPLRLLLISRCPPYPLHLGDRLIVYHLARELARRGHVIDLLAFYNRPDDPDHLAAYRDHFQDVTLIREPHRGVLAYLLRLALPGRMFPEKVAQAWSPPMWRAIAARLTARRYDAAQLFGGIHVYEYRALVQAMPNLIVPYESYTLYLTRALTHRPTPSLWLQRLIAARFERVMFGGFGGVVVLTAQDAAALRALDPALDVTVIPNGIDTEYFTPTGAAVDPATLIFTGNFEYAPNVEAARFLASAIFPLVQRAIPEARLLLVGNAPPPDLLALSGGPIQVLGRVPDVRPYLEAATVFVCPLLTGAGIKNKVLEAMAMGKPIVATPLSADGIDLIDGHHALFGQAADTLASAVVRLLADAPLRTSMGIANRALIAERFTWGAVADRYEALYRALGAGMGM